MASREEDRAEMLLKIRRREEEAARRGFERARGLAEAAEGRLSELRQLVAEHNDAARAGWLSAEGSQSAEAYRMIADDLRTAVQWRQGELRRHHRTLRRRQAELSEAITRRRAAEALCRKITRRHLTRAMRAEAENSADVHASRTAIGKIDAT